MRTLYEMKLDRGGHCVDCGKDIMDESEKDHTFCNDCWDKLLAHPFDPYMTGNNKIICAQCDEPLTHRIHIR